MFNSFKQLIQNSHERLIIVENGEPNLVVLPFEEYQHLRALEKSGIIEKKSREANPNQRLVREDHTEVNRDIASRDKAQEEYGVNLQQESEDTNSGVKIEDLPF